jgi:hypothetical protein
VPVCSSFLGQLLQLFAAARLTEDHFMPRPRKHDPELAANEPRSKNPDPHILIQSSQDQSALASAHTGEKEK